MSDRALLLLLCPLSCPHPLQADIKEMAGKSFYDMLTKDKIAPWEVVSKCKVRKERAQPRRKATREGSAPVAVPTGSAHAHYRTE